MSATPLDPPQTRDEKAAVARIAERALTLSFRQRAESPHHLVGYLGDAIVAEIRTGVAVELQAGWEREAALERLCEKLLDEAKVTKRLLRKTIAERRRILQALRDAAARAEKAEASIYACTNLHGGDYDLAPGTIDGAAVEPLPPTDIEPGDRFELLTGECVGDEVTVGRRFADFGRACWTVSGGWGDLAELELLDSEVWKRLPRAVVVAPAGPEETPPTQACGKCDGTGYIDVEERREDEGDNVYETYSVPCDCKAEEASVPASAQRPLPVGPQLHEAEALDAVERALEKLYPVHNLRLVLSATEAVVESVCAVYRRKGFEARSIQGGIYLHQDEGAHGDDPELAADELLSNREEDRTS